MKSLFKKILNLILFISYYSGFVYLLRFLNRRKARILMYHSVSNGYDFLPEDISVSPKNFELQIRYLSENYRIISLSELIDSIKEKKIPENSVVITLDDGFRDNFINAFPILQKYNVTATIFLATDCINSPEMLWIHKVYYMINEVGIEKFLEGINKEIKNNLKSKREVITFLKYKLIREDRDNLIEKISKGFEIENFLVENLYLSWDEIKEMNSEGISFGAHSCTHSILSRMDDVGAEEEIKNSREKIENKLKERIEFFTYPFGDIRSFDERIKEILKKEGFSCALSTIEGLNSIDTDLYSLRRISIVNGNSYYLMATIEGIRGIFVDLYRIFHRWRMRV